jgi:phage baseplate assembly protein W
MADVYFPLRFDGAGRTRRPATDVEHVRQMIEQILFTAPGERVNRPDFGSGLLRQVFEPNSDEVAATLQFTTQAGLQRWLGDLIEVDAVTVEAQGETLAVTVGFRMRRTQQAHVVTFERTGP